jgi:hypothetical protein
MFVLNNEKILIPGKAWTASNGVKHPSNWSSWSSDLLATYGIVEVAEQTQPDSKFYHVSSINLDGTWSATAKSIEDVTETVNGVDYVKRGLKFQWTERTNETANSLLQPSDWQVIAKAERDRAIDSNVVTYRAAVISKCTTIKAAIADCSDLDDFKALFVTPVDSDGIATGNPPIHDWPKLG